MTTRHNDIIGYIQGYFRFMTIGHKYESTNFKNGKHVLETIEKFVGTFDTTTDSNSKFMVIFNSFINMVKLNDKERESVGMNRNEMVFLGEMIYSFYPDNTDERMVVCLLKGYLDLSKASTLNPLQQDYLNKLLFNLSPQFLVKSQAVMILNTPGKCIPLRKMDYFRTEIQEYCEQHSMFIIE